MNENINSDFFDRINFKVQKPYAGCILISEPFLLDPTFQRSVIYLVEHNEKGSVGFVLNKETSVTVEEAIEEFPAFEAPVYFGGPVGHESMYYLHKIGGLLHSNKIGNNLYWGGDFEQLKSMISAGKISSDQIRFFIGYSGWSPGQLEDELKGKSWIVTELQEDLVINGTSQGFWKDVLKKLGKKFEIMANFPEDPTQN